MEMLVQKAASLRLGDAATPQAPEFPHQPHIERQPRDAVFYQQLEISVVRIEHLLFVAGYVARQFGRHLVDAPPREWALQKHCPRTRVDGLAEIHRASL